MKLFEDYRVKFGTPMKWLFAKKRAQVRAAQSRNVALEDIEQAAWAGVVRALHRYDPARGVSFPMYAHWHVWASLTHLLQRETGDTKSEHGRKKREAVHLSLNAPINDDDDHAFETFLGVHDADALAESDFAAAVRDSLNALPARQRHIVERRYGIGCEPQTLAEIGQTLKISKERVRQILTQVTDQLRTKLRGSEIEAVVLGGSAA